MSYVPVGVDDDNNFSPDVRQALAESTELSAAFVRFVDQNGDPLPPGSLTTIHVNTVTGDIDDITFEEA